MLRGAKSWSLLGWIISFSIITSLAVVLRFWSAHVQKRKFYTDDGFVLASYLGLLIQEGIGIWALCNGLGNPGTAMTLEELKIQAQVILAISITWIFCTTVIKLAVLSLYMRIFFTANFKRWAVSLMIIDICFGITFFVVYMTRCHPVSQQWDPVEGGWCRSMTPSELSSASISLALDAAIVILPMPWLWNLHMPWSKKIVATIMFGFGFATVAIMSYRIDLIVHAGPDPMLEIARVGLLSYLEIWLGIVTACLPTMAPVLKKWLQPGFCWLSQSVFGSPRPSEDNRASRVQLRTIGSSGFPGSGVTSGKGRKTYTELSETSTYGKDTEELTLVGEQSVHTLERRQV